MKKHPRCSRCCQYSDDIGLAGYNCASKCVYREAYGLSAREKTAEAWAAFKLAILDACTPWVARVIRFFNGPPHK